MAHRKVLFAAWGPRQEAIERCADRLDTYYQMLATSHPSLSTWFDGGSSKSELLNNPVPFHDRSVLVQQLLDGRNRRDTDGAVVDDLGFSAGAWNGRDDPYSAIMGVHCGAYTTAPGLWNSAYVELPKELGRLTEVAAMRNLFLDVVACWDADWAGVYDSDIPRPEGRKPEEPLFDWMLYLSRRSYKEPKLKDLAEVGAVNHSGWLTVTQEHAVNWDDPKQVSHVNKIRKKLGLRKLDPDDW